MSAIRTEALDYDARPTPKTNRWCVNCQRDVKPNAGRDGMLVPGGGWPELIHPDDWARVPDAIPVVVGTDCAKRIGLQWTKKHAADAAKEGR